MENLLNFHKEPFSALENHPNTSAYTKMLIWGTCNETWNRSLQISMEQLNDKRLFLALHALQFMWWIIGKFEETLLWVSWHFLGNCTSQYDCYFLVCEFC